MLFQCLVGFGLWLALGINLQECLLTWFDRLVEQSLCIITCQNFKCFVDSGKLFSTCPDTLVPLISLGLACCLSLVKEKSVSFHLLCSIVKILGGVGQVLLCVSFLAF